MFGFVKTLFVNGYNSSCMAALSDNQIYFCDKVKTMK